MPSNPGNAFEIMKAIGDLKSELQKDLGDIKSQNASQSTCIRNLRNELLGDGGRVTHVEGRLDDIEFWQNVKTIVVIPILLAIHKVMTAMGIKI